MKKTRNISLITATLLILGLIFAVQISAETIDSPELYQQNGVFDTQHLTSEDIAPFDEDAILQELTNARIDAIIENMISNNEIITLDENNVLSQNLLISSSENANQIMGFGSGGHHNMQNALTGLAGTKVIDNMRLGTFENWYRFDIPNDPRFVPSVTSVNIPNGYWLLLVDTNWNMWHIQTNRTVPFYAPSIGTFFIVVFNPAGTASPSNYYLHFGDHNNRGNIITIDPGLSYDFGWVNHANNYIHISDWGPWQTRSTNQTHNENIPPNARMTSMQITNDGNGRGWGGLQRRVVISNRTHIPTAGLTIVDLSSHGDNFIPVRQNFVICGRLVRSDGFIWRPLLRIGYSFPVTEANMRFLDERNVSSLN